MLAPGNTRISLIGLLAIIACFVQSACHPAARQTGDLLIPLVARPTEPALFDRQPYRIAGAEKVLVLIEPVEDSRPDPAKVGENIEEPKVVSVHTTATEVTGFVGHVFEKEIGEAGLRLTANKTEATRFIHTRLNQFFTIEKNTYQAVVGAVVAVKDTSGKTLWEGPVEGRASRFGRSLKAENYQEAFSDATQRMVSAFLDTPGARNALLK